MNILVIGSGGREHAIIKKINESKHQNNIICIGTHINPGINKIAKLYTLNCNNEEYEITLGNLMIIILSLQLLVLTPRNGIGLLLKKYTM